jgi:cellulose synthase/poly-beta-1,6-N-acetylglucosamine synthase-like glycosyltransferase/peptidoglycan/xylan/chitin deacetylase (PgdA/CDA1 family)/spore germination protein YaaH
MSNERRAPIFFDAKGRRGILLHVAGWAFSIALIVGASALVASVVTPTGLQPVALSGNAPRLSPVEIAAGREKDAFRPAAAEAAPLPAAAAETPRYAFLSSWDDNSFLSLRAHAADLDYLLAEWLHLAGDSGQIRQDDAIKEAQTRLWIRKNAGHLKIIPIVNNYNVTTRSWDGRAVEHLLADQQRRASLIANLLTYAEKGNYSAVAIDFKDLGEPALAALPTFVAEARAVFSAAGKQIIAIIPAYEKRLDLARLGAAADTVVALLYDQHWYGGAEGPLAAQDWFENRLDDIVEKIGPEKLVPAIGSYAVDWSEKGKGRPLTVAAAWDLLSQAASPFEFDKVTLNGRFGYRAPNGERHTVWMLDGVTAFNQIAAALAVEPAGVALWQLGTEEASVWKSFGRGRVPGRAVATELEVLQAGREIRYTGEGEVLSAFGRDQAGTRTLTYSETHNLVTDQTLVTLPKSLTIARWGQNAGKKIALTFDDGPSEDYTRPILEILEQKNVKATFFVVGAAAALEGDILREIYEDGHDIGNHTFTHPNLSRVNDIQLDLELNATQRVLEAKLGVGTRLFRPPFNKDTEPSTASEARTLIGASALGYITIGLKIDPLDWSNPGASEIVARTVAYAESGRGNIILLHDGGGDRSQTVEALPAMIDALKARGFEFVTVHELLGLKREDVMPTLKSSLPGLVQVNNVSIAATSTVIQWMNVLFFVAIILGVARIALVAVAAMVQTRRTRQRSADAWEPKSVAILVPAYNEEKVINDCIASLLACKGDNVSIVVVDDGSKDRTVEVARAKYGDHPRVVILTKENGGKASALNFGIAATDAEVIVAIDADTRLDPRSIEWLVRHFKDPKVGAVAGAVEVGNADNLITRFQWLEYVISQNLDRRALELVNGMIVVPGAIGAWRRDALVAIGGYDEDTLAEDADATVKLQRAGWKVLYEPMAVAHTEAPQTVGLFLRQRFRWMFGMLQVAYKHMGLWRQKNVAGLKYAAMPNLLLFQFFFTLISPVVDLILLGNVLLDLWGIVAPGWSQQPPRTATIALYWMVWQSLEIALAALAFHLEGRRLPVSSIPLLVLQRFCYRQLIYYVAIRSLLAAINGRLVGWDKLPRQGLRMPRLLADTEVAASSAKLSVAELPRRNQLQHAA